MNDIGSKTRVPATAYGTELLKSASVKKLFRTNDTRYSTNSSVQPQKAYVSHCRTITPALLFCGWGSVSVFIACAGFSSFATDGVASLIVEPLSLIGSVNAVSLASKPLVSCSVFIILMIITVRIKFYKSGIFLLDRNALRQVPWLIDIVAACDSNVVCK